MRKFLSIVTFLSFFLLQFPAYCTAQTAKDYGFISHELKDPVLGVINFYVSDTLHEQEKPLLVYLDGSGNYPLSYFKKDSTGNILKYSGIPLNLKRLQLKYHILAISKPHTPFAEELTDGSVQVFDSIYTKYAHCDWRVESASQAIDFVLSHYKVDRKKIIVLGYSEGGQVAPRLAVRNKSITHCIAFVGGGLNQFFDEIIKYRMLANKGEISAGEAQEKIEELFANYRSMYQDPESTESSWFGHSYKRWSSYTQIPTIEFLKQLTIPIYIAQGSEDQSTNVLSADYIRLEFLRLKKQNLTFKSFPGFDHTFKNPTTGENLMMKVIADSIEWAEKN